MDKPCLPVIYAAINTDGGLDWGLTTKVRDNRLSTGFRSFMSFACASIPFLLCPLYSAASASRLPAWCVPITACSHVPVAIEHGEGMCFLVQEGPQRGFSDSVSGPWTGCKAGGRMSVVVMITDSCPCHHPNPSNSRWCCGDRTHFDLSWKAFEAIGEPACAYSATLWHSSSSPFFPYFDSRKT